ncbi:MAG: DUF4097 family beta strand repeat-containing protein [Bacteroidota bacterium]
MRHLARALVLLVLPALAFAQNERVLSDTLPLDNDGKILIDTFKGTIEVKSWDRNEVSYKVEIVADEHEDLVEDTELRVRHSKGRLELVVDYEKAKKRNRRNHYSMPFTHVTVRVPSRSSVSVETHKAEIDVANIGGDVDVDTHKGDIAVRNVAGYTSIDTHKSRGRLAGLMGPLSIDTHKGVIDVELDAVEGDIDIDTHDGRITVVVPKSASLEVDAEVRRFRLDDDFKIDMVDLDNDHLKARINGGKHRFRADSYKGTVRLVAG